MAQAEEQDNDLVIIWPKSLLLNQAYAFGFACVKCDGIPLCCMNNVDGDILCGKCAKDIDNVTPTKAVQNMINKLRTRCLSVSLSADDKKQIDLSYNEESEGNIVSTQVKESSCEWIGMIKDWKEHSKQCGYMSILCTACKEYECQRKLMGDHTKQCGAVIIHCLLSCGESILRKNKESHLRNDCSEQLVRCTNDDCKENIKRKHLKQHVSDECESRMVECEFAKYGCCSKQIKAIYLRDHMDENKFDHLQQQFIFVTAQLNSKSLVKDEQISNLQLNNVQLNEKVLNLEQHINQQQKVIDEIKKKIDAQEQKEVEQKKIDLWQNAVVRNYDAHQLVNHGWKRIYIKEYRHVTSTEELKSLCDNDKNVEIFVGASHKNDKSLIILGAFGPSSVLHKMTTSLKEAYIPSDVRNKNVYNVYWYHYDNKSFGFANVPKINLCSADNTFTEGECRLSWHLTKGGGWRIGSIKRLSDSSEYYKVIYAKSR